MLANIWHLPKFKIMGRFIIVLSFLLATPQLLSQKGIDLTSDKSLTQVFNETEIKGLESMVRFVDNIVLNKVKKTDANEATIFFLKITHKLLTITSLLKKA